MLTNTTVQRDAPTHPAQAEFLAEAGAFRAPLKDRSTAMIRAVHEHTNGTWPIIGVGGISNAADAREKLEAGANAAAGVFGVCVRRALLVRNVVDGLGKTSL